jgi:hypothetical protein
VGYGRRIYWLTSSRSEPDDLVRKSLERAALGDEVKHLMNELVAYETEVKFILLADATLSALGAVSRAGQRRHLSF